MGRVLPTTIHRYRVLEELGRGGMGRVFLAYDPHLDRQIALKIFTAERAAAGIGLTDANRLGEELRSRFLREGRAAARLHHPGIVAVFDADVDPESGEPYLAMEHVAGESLRCLLGAESRLGTEEAVELAVQVARALDAAHRFGIVHRDIKPSNLLLTEDGAVKIADFGIAKLKSNDLTRPDRPGDVTEMGATVGEVTLTRPGRTLGSPCYMAPEQVRSRPVDGRADLFALGAVLYECLTGRQAFGASSLPSITFKILSIDPRPPEIYNPRVTPRLRGILDRALAKEPAERFSTAGVMAEALEAAAAELRGERPSAVLDLASAHPTQPLAHPAPVPDLAPRALPSMMQTRAGSAPLLPKRRPARWPMRMAVALVLMLGAATVWTVGSARDSRQVAVADELVPPMPAATRWSPPSRPSTPAPSSTLELSTASASTALLEPVMTSFELVHEMRLKNAQISVWIDHQRVFSERLTGGGAWKRTFDRQVLRRWVSVPEGMHTIDVHLSGISRRLEARAAIRSSFHHEEPRHLEVRLDKSRQELALSWRAPEPGD